MSWLLVRSDEFLTCQQVLEAGIVANGVPDWIDLQAHDRDGFTCRDREKFFQILHCFRGSTCLRLNFGQGGQVPGTKHCIFFGWQKIKCISGDSDRIRLAIKREINAA